MQRPGNRSGRSTRRAYVDGQPPNGTGYVHRGLAAWRDQRDGNKLRIFLNSRYRSICLDAETGTLVESFGEKGIVDLEPEPDLADREEALHRTPRRP